MQIKVRTLDQRSHEIEVEPEILVSSLKEKIKDITQVLEGRQRLIYRGRLLIDSETLSTYNVEDGHTIHMVARPVEAAVGESSGGNNNTSSTASIGRGTTIGLAGGSIAASALAAAIAAANASGGGANNNNLPALLQTQRNRVLAGALDVDTARLVSDALGIGQGASAANSVRTPAPGAQQSGQRAVRSTTVSNRGHQQFRGPESLEHVRQGLLTLHTLLSTMEEPAQSANESRVRLRRNAEEIAAITSLPTEIEDETPIETESTQEITSREELLPTTLEHTSGGTTIATPSRRIPPAFYAGQWVDVEDTVHQWLEATIMRVEQEPVRRVLIHYNGWPTRWDEWLDADSPRIAPFRTRTLHGQQAPHANPTPNTGVENAPATDFYMTSEDTNNEQHNNNNTETTRHHHRSARARRGREVRLAICESWRILQCISPLLETLAETAHTELGTPEDEDVRPDMPWRLPDTTPRRGHLGSRSGRRAIREEIRILARDAAPLVDRLGRVLSDLSPHLAALARPRHTASSDDDVSGSRAATPTSATASAITSHEIQNDELSERTGAPATAQGEISHTQEEGEDQQSAVPTQHDNETTPAAISSAQEQAAAENDQIPTHTLLDESTTPPEPNEDEPPPLTATGSDAQSSNRTRHAHRGRRRRHHRSTAEIDSYRQLVATQTRAPHLYAPSGSGNIDIHIHAILTPLRGGAGNNAAATAPDTPAPDSAVAEPAPDSAVAAPAPDNLVTAPSHSPALDNIGNSSTEIAASPSQREVLTPSQPSNYQEVTIISTTNTTAEPPAPAAEEEQEIADLATPDESPIPTVDNANYSDTLNDMWANTVDAYYSLFGSHARARPT